MEYRRRAVAVVRMPAHVNIQLAALGLRADAQVLERAADDAHAVSLEVRQRDERVRRRDSLRHISLFQQIAFRYIHAEVARADEAVAQMNGQPSVAEL